MDETAVWIEKLKIYELCARYTLTLDNHDIDGWARCFTEDGVFGYGDHGLRGRSRIHAYGEVHKTLASRHINTSLLYNVDPSGTRATGQSQTVVTLATKQGYKVTFLGRYDDELLKVDGQWLFSRRWVTADTIPDDPELDVLSVDPTLVPLIQPLLEAYQRLGEPE